MVNYFDFICDQLRLSCCHICICSRQGAADYVGEAVQNLVAHNFTGDETEPPENTGSAGWKGDIHDRKREG